MPDVAAVVISVASAVASISTSLSRVKRSRVTHQALKDLGTKAIATAEAVTEKVALVAADLAAFKLEIDERVDALERARKSPRSVRTSSPDADQSLRITKLEQALDAVRAELAMIAKAHDTFDKQYHQDYRDLVTKVAAFGGELRGFLGSRQNGGPRADDDHR